MDPVTVLLALIAPAAGIAGTLLGVGISEWLARKRAKSDRARERRLLALQQTRQLVYAAVNDALYVASRLETPDGKMAAELYPFGDVALIGDPDVIGRYFAILIELQNRRGKLTDGDRPDLARRIGDLYARANAAIASQEALAMEDKPLRSVSPDELASLGHQLPTVDPS